MKNKVISKVLSSALSLTALSNIAAYGSEAPAASKSKASKESSSSNHFFLGVGVGAGALITYNVYKDYTTDFLKSIVSYSIYTQDYVQKPDVLNAINADDNTALMNLYRNGELARFHTEKLKRFISCYDKYGDKYINALSIGLPSKFKDQLKYCCPYFRNLINLLDDYNAQLAACNTILNSDEYAGAHDAALTNLKNSLMNLKNYFVRMSEEYETHPRTPFDELLTLFELEKVYNLKDPILSYDVPLQFPNGGSEDGTGTQDNENDSRDDELQSDDEGGEFQTEGPQPYVNPQTEEHEYSSNEFMVGDPSDNIKFSGSF